MQVNMLDVYDEQGNVSEEMASVLTGHKRRLALLPGLELLDQHIQCKSDVTFTEHASKGLYFTFTGIDPIRSDKDTEAVRISYQSQAIYGHFSMIKGESRSLLQIRVDINHLASVLGETEEHTLQYFSHMKERLGGASGAIELPITRKNRLVCQPILSHQGQTISLAGHAYALMLTLVEQLQMLSHLTKCPNCQEKLFKAQNLLEVPEQRIVSVERLASLVGLNEEALSIGFHYLTGQSVERYLTSSRIQQAAAKLRHTPEEKASIVAQSGFSEDQFESIFQQHFGVTSHQYRQIH